MSSGINQTNQANQAIGIRQYSSEQEVLDLEARRTQLLNDLAWIHTKENIRNFAIFVFAITAISLALYYGRKL